MSELPWDGFREHTEQGWNIGRPPYDYRAEKRPHPVPARRAEGKTKTRLVPDPITGPVVTKIFHMRALDRHGYDHIADQLNIDFEQNPPPIPVDSRRAVGRWTGSAVSVILISPKYTGYMLWNRRASGRGEWIWSPRPTHEPLVSKELFFAERVFGPKLHQHLRSKLNQTRDTPADEINQARKAKLANALADTQRRQDNLMPQLEDHESTGDPEYRTLQQRFAN